MSATQMAAAPARENEIIATLRTIVSEMSGIRPSEIDLDATFIEMGAESLFMLQASHSITEKLGVKVPFRLLMEEYPTLRSLAAYIDQKLPAPAPVEMIQPEVQEPVPVVPEPAPVAVAPPVELPKPAIPMPPLQNLTGSSSSLEQIVAQQLQIMQQQLEVMRTRQPRAGAPAAIPVTTTQPAAPQTTVNVPKTEDEPFVPFRPISKPATSTLTEQQQRHLDALIERVSRKTQRSKQLTQEYRPYFADSREVAGFRSLWKEIQYLIIVEQALGSKIRDVDGNEYLDITMGFGSLLFGHSPDFVTKALQQQVAQGIQLGPQSHLAGRVAKLVCELTGVERVTFCNSGTEAVMTALRLARAVTGRTKIAMFTGSYHGTFDGTLARAERGANGKLRTVPLAPGVPPSMIEDVMILNYGAPESLEEIREHASELAAVLVEPLQSRRPDNRPSEFLLELRRITEQSGTTLILDEVVSGFRLHPGGAQVLFNIKADLVTYGKAAGAGMPIGIIAGKAKYMDPIDGGMWQYGDESYPRANTTFFVGTFFKHPMVMAAAFAALTHIKNSGPQLQEGLSQKTQYLADTLNRYFDQEHVPIRITNCGSLFRFTTNEVKYMDLFFYHLLEKGIYVWEGRNCFISTAHTDEDLEFLISKVKETVVEMRAGGFLGEAPVNAGGNGHKTIAPRPVEKETVATGPRQVPLTEGQKQLWTLAQMDPDASRAYNESMALHLHGPLSISALRSAMQLIVNRHDALRTTIDPAADNQVIAPSLTVDVPLFDVSTKDDPETLIADWQTEEARKLFDFVRGPLFRASVLKVSPEYHILVLTIHGLVIDGWSMGILLRELSKLYEAECRRVAPSLPPAKQFSEYVQLQSQQQESPEMDRAEAYWLEQYPDSIPVLELPTDRPRPRVQTYNGLRERLVIDASLSSALKHVSVRERATLFMTLLAGYQVLLHRLTNQEDVVVGFTPAGQVSVIGDDLIGYCFNLLPLRSHLGDDPSFSEYLVRAKRVLSDALDHQIYALPNLIRKLKVKRDPSRPVITTTFNLDRGNRMQFFDLDVEIIPVAANSSKFDLGMNVTDQDGELIVEIDYNSDLFDATTIHRWLGHFRTLLAGVVANPRQRLSELPLLDEQEQQQMLVEWNRTQAEFPNRTLNELFEAQVESTPDQIALIFADEKLTYRELNERANRVAHYLRRQGVETETLVGVMLKRSIDLIVTILGVSKAGGAYVPLDPNYPVERLSFMLEDTHAPLLVTTERFADLVPTTARKVLLDVEAEQISQESGENLSPAATADHLIYVIYTSGSTGTPKGTLITHSGLVNYVIWAIEGYPATAGNGSPLHTSLSFDLTLTNLYPALLAGRAVEIVPETEGVTGLVEALLRKPNYSLVKLTPAHCQLVGNKLAEQPAEQLSQLSHSLVIGGENLLAEQAKWWREQQPQIRLFNEYGPTETVVGCCIYEVQPETAWTGSVPIGKPITNMQHYVLDAKGQPAPVGIAGELYIGGAGVGRGYLNRPDLTAERFLPDPFSGAPGARMYRTGDEARYRADGVIEYLGRLDQQVKLRGFRIELGEIEAVLSQHPNVREAVVVVRGEAEEKRLFAYVCGEFEAAATELRNFLKEYLPEYMVPAAFIVLDKMPLSNSGKVDRKRLPEPETSRPSLAETYVEPRTEVERVLAKIWSEVLSLEQVGIHDNFFELGGDSILSVQIVARAHQAGLQLTANEVFYHQTIAGLAAVAENAPDLTAAAQGEVTGPVELTPIQHWFFEQELPEPNHFNMSVIVSAGNDLNLDALRGSLAAVLRHHDALRMRYEKLSDGTWRQRCAPVAEVEVSLEVVDLNAVPAEELHDAIEKVAADSQRTLNLEQGPIFKAVYIDLGADRGARLLLVVHHLVMDMISWRILFEDLQTVYQQITNREAVQLRAKSTSYQQWAAQLKAYASSAELSQEVGYWTDERRQQIQPLPVDHHGRNLESTIKYVNNKLSKELTEALLREVPRVYHTQVNEVLFAALAGMYQQWTSERYLIVDVEGHGRETLSEEVLLTRTVGWFTSLYPLLLEVEAGSDYGDRLKSIKEQVRRVKNGGVGYGVLRYLSADEALRTQLRELPEAEISFNYVGQYDQAVSEVKEAGLFRGATEWVGLVRAGEGDRRYKLQVNGTVMGGELFMSWEYNPEVHREETVVQLATDYLRELERLIRHCQNENAGGFTPSDFTEFKWSESDLDDISAAIEKARGAV
jgi:amino acid adenylation domain-containing protein/non-ribosomal peptide synthase protein (TIGR01720 family)